MKCLAAYSDDKPTKVHDDAESLCEHLYEQGGTSTETIGDMAIAMGWFRKVGTHLEIDRGRWYSARNHVQDGVGPDGDACCGWRLHYKDSKPGSPLSLVDPKGNLATLAQAGIGRARGFIAREKQRQTENMREVETLRTLSRQCLQAEDFFGQEATLKAAMNIEEHGTILPKTVAEMEVWLTSLSTG